MKILYFDTETTGTDINRHEITQFAAIIEVDGVVKEKINMRCKPTKWDDIDPQALATTGITKEQLATYQDPKDMLNKIKFLLGKYVPKYTKMPDKFYPAGHNVQFDLEFLNKLFKDHGNEEDKKWGITSFQNWRALDSRVFANFLLVAGELQTDDVKLSSLCDHYGIKINAHDALSDIEATRELIQNMIFKVKNLGNMAVVPEIG